MRLYDYLDLRFQELRNAVSQNLQEPPEDPKAGLFYFNTDTKRWYIFDGEKWVDCTLQLIDFSCTITGITYNPETGEFSLDEGYVIPTIQQFQDLWDAIATETQARIDADTILQENIDAEELARINADNTLQENIDFESNARENADTVINNKIEDIEDLIPAEATSSNKLADKDFVVDNIKTYASSYRGSWPTWADVPTNAEDYPADTDGNKIPDANDYMIVTEDETQDGGTWRYIYTGIWATEGKSGWKAEYKMQNSPFSPEQQAAIDSGITSALVTQIGVNKNNIEDINTTLGGFGNIVTHNVAEFATASQGALADTAVQPEDLGDGTITFIQGDEEKGSITVNQKGNTTIYLDKGSTGGIPNLDGGFASTIYVFDQIVDCGSAQD